MWLLSRLHGRPIPEPLSHAECVGQGGVAGSTHLVEYVNGTQSAKERTLSFEIPDNAKLATQGR